MSPQNSFEKSTSGEASFDSVSLPHEDTTERRYLTPENRNIVVLGGSRGLGEAIALGLSNEGDHVWTVSRSKPNQSHSNHHWIEASLSYPIESSQQIKRELGSNPIDILVYNAGIWESESFDRMPPDKLLDIINTNLSSLILSVHSLIDNLKQSKNSRIFLISSTCGLENEGSDTVAYVASKFGVRGAAHALREYFRSSGITVTCISPGSMATDIPLEAGASKALDKYEGARMPVSDIVILLRAICSMSKAACPKEIDIPATKDTDA